LKIFTSADRASWSDHRAFAPGTNTTISHWVCRKPDLEIDMKRLILCIAVAGLAFTSAAEAKGCIKGAIVGGVAGHIAGHGKVGAVAGCVIGRHEANKADANKAAQRNGNQPAQDGKI
jgi:hypothetical protein